MTAENPHIIDHVPSRDELLDHKYIDQGHPMPTSEVRETLAKLGIGALQESAPVTPTPRTESSVSYDPAQETARQMGIAAADRQNRTAAGLPPRTPDLR